MHHSRSYTSRSYPRAAAAVGCAALLTTALSACGATERLTTGLKVKSAVERLGEQPTASAVASLDASPKDAYAFLKQVRPGISRERAALISRAELTVAIGSGDDDTPLKDMDRSDAVALAGALNFGGGDAVAVKSVREKLYLRVDLESLVAQTGGSTEARERARKIAGLADDLPLSLRSARHALQGEWVEADPAAFDDFARTAQIMSAPGGGSDATAGGSVPGGMAGAGLKGVVGERSRQLAEATAVASALNGQAQRAFIGRLEKALRGPASFTATGKHAGADRVRVTLPARQAAEDLSPALTPLGAEVDPARVPDRDVSAELEIRRGQLVRLTLDLGQFTGGRPDDHLPLKLDLGAGAAVPVDAPGGAEELKPQDLLAAIMYGALGRTGS